MKNSTVIAMTALVLVAIGALLFMNLAPYASFKEAPSSSLVSNSEIRGIAVVHRGVPFTLNFDEQKVAVDSVMRAVTVKKADYPEVKGPFDFDKIIIYRFNAPEIELFPIQFPEQNLVFSMPPINKDKYYMELSGGEFKRMISQSFDP